MLTLRFFKARTHYIVKSLNQKIVTGGDKLGLPLYNWLTMHPIFLVGEPKIFKSGGCYLNEVVR